MRRTGSTQRLGSLPGMTRMRKKLCRGHIRSLGTDQQPLTPQKSLNPLLNFPLTSLSLHFIK
jgi:hypothetical protein